jgi:hypothetical protein
MDLEGGYDQSCLTALDCLEVDSGSQERIEMADRSGAVGTERVLLTNPTSAKIPVRRTILGCSIAGYALEPGPIFNYSRFWNHLQTAEYVGNAFCALNCNLKAKRSIQGKDWIEDPRRWKENLVGSRGKTSSANGNDPSTSATDQTSLTGTSLDQDSPHEVTPEEMESYVSFRFSAENVNTPGISHNFIVAAAVAVILQWGTTGSAILIAYQLVPLRYVCL